MRKGVEEIILGDGRALNKELREELCVQRKERASVDEQR